MHVKMLLAPQSSGTITNQTGHAITVDPGGRVWSDGIRVGEARVRRVAWLSDDYIYVQGATDGRWWRYLGSSWSGVPPEVQSFLDTL